MYHTINLKKFSFLIYGLGSTGLSVVNYFKKKNFSNFFVWDDNSKLVKKNGFKNVSNLEIILNKVDYIVLSPGISLKKSKNRKKLIKFKKKIITDIDLLYLTNSKFKSIVVTGTNGKSTTCKIISHLLKKNNYKVKLGGNIGKPVLNLQVKKDTICVIEASSFQLSHSKFIHPNYALLLNITNDHLDWHGSMKNYTHSKFKIFKLQNKNNFALINSNLKNIFKKNNFSSKLVQVKFSDYKKVKLKIKNNYLKSNINDENMNFVYSLAKLLKIKNESFIKSMSSFSGLSHRYEVFLKKKNITFINDSKATTLQAAKFALDNSKNIFWILGGLPKYKDKINLKDIKKNIIKSYIIGKNIIFFKKQLKDNVNFTITKNLKNSVIQVLKDIKLSKEINNTILLSPGAASFDQFRNFENRGNEFKKLSRIYAKKFI
ncbi:MAG: UDP-N-acetylmuramoyl-L-alanine--D-glutamate ligase [Candidatus Pelagibacter sp. TMED128]|nr:MAG: UDP-N-acetylmuramoyl-L-alanine--D-glutamate ligase [Candidatus Pelagibacter sp. TMED128]